ncbi:hypothetical protein ACWXWU_19005 [Shewanella sp. A14]
MKNISLSILSLLGLISLVGCSNAVTYHHSERNSIALESRTTDPQQPLQGTIGVKTRTVVVTPKTNEATGNATSVVSDFELSRKSSDDWYKFGTTTINSSFMTGQAAKNASADSILAINGLASGSLGELNVRKKMLIQNIYSTLAKINDKEALALRTQLDQLSQLLPDVSKMMFYRMDQNGNNVITNISDKKVTTLPTGFSGVQEYLNLVESSITALNEMQHHRAATHNGKPIDKAQLALLEQAKKTLIKDRETFALTIGNSPLIDNAAAYVVGLL